MDESNATCGKRLDSIGVENNEDNRKAYREMLVTAPGECRSASSGQCDEAAQPFRQQTGL